MNKYTGDFETTTDKKDCRVWAWGLCNIENEFFEYGNDLDSFFQRLANEKNNMEIWFHNLKFDGEFMIHWLLTHNFTYSSEKRLANYNFSILMSYTGLFYSMDICLNKHLIHIKDSLKKLPFSVEKIGKDFHVGRSKGTLDYKKFREIGHDLTQQEIEYLKGDVLIMARALKIAFENGNKKITAGADALARYKIFNDKFKTDFPILSKRCHEEIALAYKGGWTYAHRTGDVGKGIVCDVNSLYPFSMYDTLLPYGVPLYFSDKYIENEEYPLYIQFMECMFELRKGYLPTVQLKNSLDFMPTQYLHTSGKKLVFIAMTNIDLEIFFKHYHVYNIEYKGGYMFKGKKGMFKDYIDFFMNQKMNSTGAVRAIAKLMQNSLYGKFGTQLDITGKYPVLEDGIVKYKLKEQEFRDGVYMPIACFTTAYARRTTITAAQDNIERFCYADTDSLHLTGYELPDLDIDDKKLGAWKIENYFTRARFIRAKTYVESLPKKRFKLFRFSVVKIGNGKRLWNNVKFSNLNSRWYLNVKCCGMPDKVKREVTWDNFKVGFKSYKKLRPCHVKGGIVLEESEFEIKG